MSEPRPEKPKPPAPPLWRQAFDAAERAVTPRAENLVRTEGFNVGAALVRRAQTLAKDSARGLTARAWHLINLPAGSDVSRLRAQIGSLDREVRRLTPATGGRAAPRPPARPPHFDGGAPCRPCPARRRSSTGSGATSSATPSARVTGSSWSAGVDRPGVGLTPKDVVWQRGRSQLWHYRNENVRYGPPLLIVFSLVSRSYILDLRPGASFIEALVEAGFDVYMLDWGEPDERDADNRLEDYVDDYIPGAIDRDPGPLRRRRGQPVRLLLRREPHAALRRAPPGRPAAQPDRAGHPGGLPAHGAAGRRLPGGRHDGRLRARVRRERAAVLRRPGVPDAHADRRGDPVRQPVGAALERRVRGLLPGDDRLVGRPRAVPGGGRARDGADARPRQRDDERPADRRRRRRPPERHHRAVPDRAGRTATTSCRRTRPPR